MEETLTIKQKYNINGYVASTRSADLFRALELESNNPILLWSLRYPLINGQAALVRLAQIKALSLPEVPILESGIDKDGVLYTASPSITLLSIKGKLFGLQGKFDTREAERRFIPCLKILSTLHSHGICCGDICDTSFWADRGGKVFFLGVMGTHDGFASGTAVLPPLETLQYMAPEQRTGSEASRQSDVFALGVLGYELFTGRSPWDEEQLTQGTLEEPRPPSSINESLPAWVDEVLMRALSLDPLARYSDASIMMQSISTVRQEILHKRSLPNTTSKITDLNEAGKAMEELLHQEKDDVVQEDPLEPVKPSDAKKRMLLLGGVSFLFVVVMTTAILAVIKIYRSVPPPAVESNPLLQHREATNDLRMKLAIDTLSADSQGMEKKLEGIKDLASSDDPLAHEVLLASALQPTSVEQHSASEQAIVTRTKRLGYPRTAEQLRLWLRTVDFPTIPERYESIVRSANPFLTAEQATPLLKNIYASEPGLALRLTVARGLDSGSPQNYEILLREFIGDQRGLTQPVQGTWATLILEEMDLAVVFGEEALPVIVNSDPDSLKQLILRLANRNDSLLQPITKILADKNVLAPAPQTILRIVGQRDDISNTLQAALTRMAFNTTNPQDFLVFAQWVDPDAEQVLYALCAAGANPTEALELLAGRNLQDKQIAAVVERVRSAYWEKRDKVSKAIGVLALHSTMDEASINDAVKQFEPFGDDKKTINALLGLGDEHILQAVIKTFPDKVGFGALLKLLESNVPEVRITAVHSLKAFNDVSALKVILSYYDKEKNEDVRKAYQDTFWNIADKK